MSTYCQIGILNKKGIISAIGCQWDGFHSHNGIILYFHYKSITKIKNLLDLGDLSSLGQELDVKKNGVREYGIHCVAYQRDYGEKKGSLIECKIEDFFELDPPKYTYIFKESDKAWYCLSEDKTKLEKLEEVLMKDKDVSLKVKKEILEDKVKYLNKKLPIKEEKNNPKKLKI